MVQVRLRSVYAPAIGLRRLNLTAGTTVSNHQPDGNAERGSETAPAQQPREAQDRAPDLPELDFSRLRMARASLDAAFPRD
jgi:hypothetical protein